MRSRIGAGVVAGLVAGLVFGIMMQLMTVPMLGEGSMMTSPMPGEGSMMTSPMPGEGSMMTSPMPEHRRPMIAMMAQVVGSESLIVGWIYVLVSSVVAGGVFGWILGGRAASIRGGLAWGALYGVFLWVFGALLLMPILLGMPALAPLSMAPMRPSTLWSLVGHLVAGLILGGVFAGLHRGPATSEAVPRA